MNGRVAGVWRERESLVELLVWEDVAREALMAEARRLGRFLTGDEVEAVVRPYPPDVYVGNPFNLKRRLSSS